MGKDGRSLSHPPSPPGMSCRTTLVTAYFEIGGGQHSPAEYRRWAANLRDSAACLVVFTDRPEIWRGGAGYGMHIVETALCAEARFLNRTWSFWRRQWFMDPEAQLHGGYLPYLVWNLKVRFLMRGVELNPFRSDHFFFVDAGYVRDRGASLATTVRAPRLSPRRGVRVLEVGAYTPAERGGGRFRYTVGQDRIAGGMFGGRVEDIRPWHDLYYGTVMVDYVRRGWFVGKEQNLLATMCAEHTAACVVIRPYGFPFFMGNVWFSLWNCLFGSTPFSEV